MGNSSSKLALFSICLVALIAFVSGAGYPQSVGGEFGKGWLSGYNAQNAEPVRQDKGNDLWTWGSSPKGSIIVNGNLVPDPYYIWKALNYSGGWLGVAYVDPVTRNPVFSFVDPYTGSPVYFYVDPKTGRPVYVNSPQNYRSLYFAYPNYGSMTPYGSRSPLIGGYTLPPVYW